MIVGHAQLIADFKRLAGAGELAHAYLFFGPRRVGKATFARGLVRYLEQGVFDADSGGPPLGDALVVQTSESLSVGIDEVRAAKHFLSLTPNRSRYRTAVFPEAEYLTTEAQHALLKVTEEPPRHGMLLLVIDDPERLLPTLRSRLQAVHFGPVGADDIQRFLQKAHEVPAREAKRLADAAHGAPGLAWAMHLDERFKGNLETAEKLFALPPRARGAFIKELVQGDAFNLESFTEALALVGGFPGNKNASLWHRLLEVQRLAHSFPLNARLQLTALAELW